MALLGLAIAAGHDDQSRSGRSARRTDELVLLRIEPADKLVDELLVPSGDGINTSCEEQLERGDPRQGRRERRWAEHVEGPDTEVAAHGGLAHLVQPAPGLHGQPIRLLRTTTGDHV